ncbi:MAG: hypothetical protein RR840_00970 [Clostridium sp.]
MRKISLILLALLLVLLSSCTPKKENLTGEVTVPKPLTENTLGGSFKLTKLDGSLPVTLDNINKIGFSKAILQVEGVREHSGNYKTNFKNKNALQKNLKLFSDEKIPYYIEIVSGPGLSSDRSIDNLYSDPNSVVYFAQMVRETIELNNDNDYFNGIILSLGIKDLNDNVYFNTLKGIVDRVIKDYKYPILITLDGNLLDSKDINLPDNIFESDLVGYNIDMSLECDSYPGVGTINGIEDQLSKNNLLDKLIRIKDSEQNNKNLMVSFKNKWNDDCDVLIKDIFEIMKILGFEFNLSYSNTNNEYDFTHHKDIMNIIQKF